MMTRVPSTSFDRLNSMIGRTVDTGRGFSVVIKGHGPCGSMFCESLDPTRPCYDISSGIVEIAWYELEARSESAL